MIYINRLLLIAILTQQGYGFSVPVTQNTNKAAAQKETKSAKPTDAPSPVPDTVVPNEPSQMQEEAPVPPGTLSHPAFMRPRSLLRQFDSMFPSPFHEFDRFFDTPLLTSMDIMPFFEDFDRQRNDMLLKTRVSPSYEISEDDKSVKLVIDVPGVKAEDINVEIEADGKMLHVTGKRLKKEGNSVSESRFDKRFSIGKQFDSENVSASLVDGVLTIVAPKVVEERNVRKIEVKEGSMGEKKE